MGIESGHGKMFGLREDLCYPRKSSYCYKMMAQYACRQNSPVFSQTKFCGQKLEDLDTVVPVLISGVGHTDSRHWQHHTWRARACYHHRQPRRHHYIHPLKDNHHNYIREKAGSEGCCSKGLAEHHQLLCGFHCQPPSLYNRISHLWVLYTSFLSLPTCHFPNCPLHNILHTWACVSAAGHLKEKPVLTSSLKLFYLFYLVIAYATSGCAGRASVPSIQIKKAGSEHL